MAEIKTEQEPSIEEILESIRQIISEDGTPVAQQEGQQAQPAKPAPKAPAPPPEKPPQKAQTQAPAQPQPPQQPPKAAAPPPPQPVKAAPPPPPPQTSAPVLELTDKVEEEKPVEEAKPRIVMQEIEAMESAPLMSELTEEAAVAAMAKILAQNLAVERELPGKPGPLTLEDIARDIMHPLIKVWLDKNLPVIIEKLVAREIEKLAHRAMDKHL